MTRIHYALGLLLLVATTYANEINDDTDIDPRFFFLNNNSTSLSVSFASLIYGLFALLALGLLAALLAFFLFGSGGEETGYSTGTSYSSYGSGRAAASADPYSAIWDNLSVLDWIAMMEELYRTFDATKMECQQRLVCELQQNENTWGNTARKMNDAFGYLQYLELLNLPAELRTVLDTYLEAANKGRTSQTSCEDLYQGCEFSMKTLISKYNGNNAI